MYFKQLCMVVLPETEVPVCSHSISIWNFSGYYSLVISFHQVVKIAKYSQIYTFTNVGPLYYLVPEINPWPPKCTTLLVLWLCPLPSNLGYPGVSFMTLAVPRYWIVSLVNPSPNLSKMNFKIMVSNHYLLPSYRFGHDMTVVSIFLNRIPYYRNSCGTHKACSILQSLSYERLLSILVRPTKICFWKITYSKNFSHFHLVINSFPSGTRDLSELSGNSMLIDPSFLVQFLKIPNRL